MALSIGTPLPSLDGATLWLNTPAAQNAPRMDEPKAILVYFWAMSCPACKATMPDLQVLRDKYAPLGLQTIAIHSPRGSSDINAEAATEMAQALGISEPCAIDDESVVVNRFQTGGVYPIYFVFGPTGKLKVRAAGGFGVTMCKSALANVFKD